MQVDKNPGVRPRGIGEVMRRIIGRTITKCLKNETKSLSSNYQLCEGQKYGIAIIENATDAVLLIDAEYAFNSLNRKLALKNIIITFTSLSKRLRTPTSIHLICSLKKTSYSQEEATQGDPLAMAIYGLAIIPLINLFISNYVTQKWYTDEPSTYDKIDDKIDTDDKIV